jgi:hypothetical protein
LKNITVMSALQSTQFEILQEEQVEEVVEKNCPGKQVVHLPVESQVGQPVQATQFPLLK